MKVTKCTGEGQGSCKRCLEKGKMEYQLDVLFIQNRGL